MELKVAVIQFPGSNCERETLLALKRAGLKAEPVLWNADLASLKDYAAYVIVGGFSYEDRVRSGLIAAMDPLMKALAVEAESGKVILGICNGAQILVESGLVPGLENNSVAMALASNQRILDGKLVGTGFYNTWTHVKASKVNEHNAFSSEVLASTPMHIPVAHGEGRFLLDEDLYAALQKTDAVFYYYCNEQGEVIDRFPVNPNGARFALAGVSNARGNVLALMPHPERTLAGDPLFLAIKNYLERWQKAGCQPLSQMQLHYQAPKLEFKPYVIDNSALHFWVGLNINDNEALSLEHSLQTQGLPLKLRRYVHWQIQFDQAQDYRQVIEENDFIFNRQKEYAISLDQVAKRGKKVFIVRPIEDELALHKKESLQKHDLSVQDVRREIVWVVDADEKDLPRILDFLHSKPIFGNPLSHLGFVLP